MLLAFGGAQAAGPLTLDEAWRLAESANPALRAARAGLDAAEGQLRDASGILYNNPQLSTDQTRRRLTQAGLPDNRFHEQSFGISQAFEIAGQAGHRREAASRDLVAVTENIDEVRRQVRALRPWRVLRTPYRVAEVRPERGHVWTLALEPTSGERLRFAPGQFAWLTLHTSPYAMREHPFSIASSATRPGRIEFGIKELGDFTATIKDMRPGETAYLDAPYGTFCIDHQPDAEGYVFIAGGIGIAPILSMLRTLADRGDGRPLVLFYGNRVWERVAFREELETLAQRLSLRVEHVLLEPPADWSGERGFISQEVLARHLPAAGMRLQYFLCGPTLMSLGVERSLAALGVPAAHVHSEIFDWV